MAKNPVKPRILDLTISASKVVGQRQLNPNRIRALLRRYLTAAHRILSPCLTELSVALVDARTMAQLHMQYLNVPGPTDVLTFELEHDSSGQVISGEVVICPAVARVHVGRNSGRFHRELLLYALHGMLHLCGFDDKTPADFAEMHAKEDEILMELELGAVFAPPAARQIARNPARSLPADMAAADNRSLAKRPSQPAPVKRNKTPRVRDRHGAT